MVLFPQIVMVPARWLYWCAEVQGWGHASRGADAHTKKAAIFSRPFCWV